MAIVFDPRCLYKYIYGDVLTHGVRNDIKIAMLHIIGWTKAEIIYEDTIFS